MAEFKWYGISPDAGPPIEFILKVLMEKASVGDLMRAQNALRRESSELLLLIINEFMDLWAEGLQKNDSALVFVAHTGIMTFANMDPNADECDNMIPDTDIVRMGAVSYAMSDDTRRIIKDADEDEFIESYIATRLTPIMERVKMRQRKMQERVFADLNIDDVEHIKERWREALRKGKMS